MDDKDVFQFRQAVAGDDAVGGQTRLGGAFVFDGIGDGEHEIGVDGNLAGEDQTLAVVPAEGDRFVRRQRAAGDDLPFRLGARHIGGGQAIAGGPAEDGVIRGGLADGRQQAHVGRGGVDGLAVGFQRQVIQPPAQHRDGAGEFRGVDGQPGRLRLRVGAQRRSGCGAAGGGGQGRVGGGGHIGGDGAKLDRGLFRKPVRKQQRPADEPCHDHHKAEHRGEDEISVLIIHKDCHHCCSGSAVVQQQGGGKGQADSPVAGITTRRWR